MGKAVLGRGIARARWLLGLIFPLRNMLFDTGWMSCTTMISTELGKAPLSDGKQVAVSFLSINIINNVTS
jgi:hypothetical protein